MTTEVSMIDKKRKDYAFQRQFHEKSTIILGRPGKLVGYLVAISKPSRTERAAKALGAFSRAACSPFITASPLTCSGQLFQLV